MITNCRYLFLFNPRKLTAIVRVDSKLCKYSYFYLNMLKYWDMYIIQLLELSVRGDWMLHVHFNRIGGVMVRVLTSSVVDRGLKLQYGQTKDYKISICCFSAKHAALRRTSKDWLARNQNNASEWSDMFNRGLFQWASTINIQLGVLV